MKTNITTIFLLSLFLWSAVPINAQKYDRSEYFKNNSELGGDVTITGSEMQIMNDESFTIFEINAALAGDYHINFWLLPTEYKDGSFSTFKVLVNGNEAGRIVATKGNWQNIGLSDNGKVTLQKGDNTISIAANLPEVADVEFVRLSKSAKKAVISSDAYDSYLSKAKSKFMEDNTYYPEDINETESENIDSRKMGYATWVRWVTFRYSVRKLTYFTAGQEIYITSQGGTPHVLDFFIDNDGTVDNQYLSWLKISEPERYNPSIQKATIKVTIPITGYYMVKVRSYENGVAGTVDININNTYIYQNNPIYYSGRPVVMGEDRDRYAIYTITDSSDPILFVEGCGSFPGRVVAYNDDAPESKRMEHMLGGRDSYIEKNYFMPTSGIHVSCYSSNDPAGTCEMFANFWVPNTNTPMRAPGKSNDPDALGETTGITQINMAEAHIYPNPVNLSALLNIDSTDEISRMEVYDISGCLIQNRALGNTQLQIPVSELNINRQGIYVIRLVGTIGTTNQRLIVR